MVGPRITKIATNRRNGQRTKTEALIRNGSGLILKIPKKTKVPMACVWPPTAIRGYSPSTRLRQELNHESRNSKRNRHKKNDNLRSHISRDRMQ